MLDITFLGLLALCVVVAAVTGVVCFIVDTLSKRPRKKTDSELQLEVERLRAQLVDLQASYKKETEVMEERGDRLRNAYDNKARELAALQQLHMEVTKTLFKEDNIKEFITCKCKQRGN